MYNSVFRILASKLIILSCTERVSYVRVQGDEMTMKNNIGTKKNSVSAVNPGPTTNDQNDRLFLVSFQREIEINFISSYNFCPRPRPHPHPRVHSQNSCSCSFSDIPRLS